MTPDLESSLRISRAAVVELTHANARLVAELDAERQARTEAERAVAAMRGALEHANDWLTDYFGKVEDMDTRGLDDHIEKHELEMLKKVRRALSTPIGSGWLSPAEAARRDARIEALEVALEHERVCGTCAEDGCSACHKCPARKMDEAAAHPTEEAKP